MGSNDFLPEASDPGESVNELWRLAEELTVTQCALLLLGLDPQEYEYVENWAHHRKPAGYLAARDALSAALKRKSVDGHYVERLNQYCDPDGQVTGLVPASGSIDPEKSMIDVESLIGWLDRRGYRHGFLNSVQSSLEPYLDPKHERYAPKLAAAVSAWKAVSPSPSVKQSPKQQILKWLRQNAAQYGLSDEDGKPNERGIEEIAKVANWAPGGGAPKTSV